MGQNESQEHLYQPQILRDARQREGDGAHEEPSEVSPERDIVVQRKKPSQANKESFGIKLNNLNASSNQLAPAQPEAGATSYSKKHTSGSEKTSNKQISVSDYIEEQKRTNGAPNFYNYQNSNSYKNKSNSDEVSNVTSMQESSANSGKSNISLLQDYE